MNKKILGVLVLVLMLAFSTTAFASLTFTSDAITGTTASTIDLGVGNNLLLQTSGGRVGIGDLTPDSVLDIEQTNSTANLELTTSQVTLTDSGVLGGTFTKNAFLGTLNSSGNYGSNGNAESYTLNGIKANATYSGVLNSMAGDDSLMLSGVNATAGWSGTVGDASDIAFVYGIRASSGGDIGTTGLTRHYGGRFDASGTADANYGIYASATGATNNYAAIFADGNIGIGTTVPNKKVEINLGTTDALRLTYDNAFGTATTYMDTTLSSTGMTTFTGAGSAPAFKFANDVTPSGRLIVPMGELSYFSTTGTAVPIAASSNGSTNMVLVAPTTALSMGEFEFDNGGANNGRLRYTGATTKMFHTAITMSIAPDGANDTFVVGLAKNGTVISSSKVLQKITNASDTQAFAFHLMVELATNDYIEVYIGNTSDADDLILKTLNIFAVGM
ncbi:MAG: hypothetical protein WA060_02450 [Minisyncoccia bacterium]